MVGSVELVLFAIRTGVRLFAEARRAYVDNTRQRALVLPLPNVDLVPSLGSAITWFSHEGARYLQEVDGLAALHREITASAGVAHPREAEYLAVWSELQRVEVIRLRGQPLLLDGGGALDADALIALVRVQQFQKGDPRTPRTIERLSGTLIELGIDYFAQVPGALGPHTRGARVVAGVVDALDRIPFAEISFDEAGMRELAGRLFVSALETLSKQPEIVTGDANVRELVAAATEGLARDAAREMQGLRGNQVLRERLAGWTELVFRSLLATAGTKVVSEPVRFLGLSDDRQGALIRGVGTAFIEIATRDPELNLRRVFGGAALDRLVDAALEAVADHPELLARGDGRLAALVSGLARDLAAFDAERGLDLVPELGRLVLLHAGRNLPLVWRTDDPGEHLLLTATKVALETLAAAPPDDARWQPAFGRTELVALIDGVLEQLVANPAWMQEAAKDIDSNLRAVLASALDALRRQADPRLGTRAAAAVMTAAIEAVALRRGMLAVVDGEARPLVAAAIEAMLAPLLEDSVDLASQWQLLRDEALEALVRAGLRELARRAELDAEALKLLAEATRREVTQIARGGLFDSDGFSARLRIALAA